MGRHAPEGALSLKRCKRATSPPPPRHSPDNEESERVSVFPTCRRLHVMLEFIYTKLYCKFENLRASFISVFE